MKVPRNPLKPFVIPGHRGENGGLLKVKLVMDHPLVARPPDPVRCCKCNLYRDQSVPEGQARLCLDHRFCTGHFEPIRVPLRKEKLNPNHGRGDDPAWKYIVESIQLALQQMDKPKAYHIRDNKYGVLLVRTEDLRRYLMLFSAEATPEAYDVLSHQANKITYRQRKEFGPRIYNDARWAFQHAGDALIMYRQVPSFWGIGSTR